MTVCHRAHHNLFLIVVFLSFYVSGAAERIKSSDETASSSGRLFSIAGKKEKSVIVHDLICINLIEFLIGWN